LMRRGIAGYIPLIIMCVIVAAFIAVASEERYQLMKEAMEVQKLVEESSLRINATFSNGVVTLRNLAGKPIDVAYVITLHACGHRLCMGEAKRCHWRLDPWRGFRLSMRRGSIVCLATKDLELICIEPKSRSAGDEGALSSKIEAVLKQVQQVRQEVSEVVESVNRLSKSLAVEIQNISVANMMLALLTKNNPSLYLDLARNFVIRGFERVVIGSDYPKIAVYVWGYVYRIKTLGSGYSKTDRVYLRYGMLVGLVGRVPQSMYLALATDLNKYIGIYGRKALEIVGNTSILMRGLGYSVSKDASRTIVVYRGYHYRIVLRVSGGLRVGTLAAVVWSSDTVAMPSRVTYTLELVPDPGYYVALFINKTIYRELKDSQFAYYNPYNGFRCYEYYVCIDPKSWYGINYNVFRVYVAPMKSVGSFMYLVTDKPVTLLRVTYVNGGYRTVFAAPYHPITGVGDEFSYLYIIHVPGQSYSMYVFTLQKR